MSFWTRSPRRGCPGCPLRIYDRRRRIVSFEPGPFHERDLRSVRRLAGPLDYRISAAGREVGSVDLFVPVDSVDLFIPVYRRVLFRTEVSLIRARFVASGSLRARLAEHVDTKDSRSSQDRSRSTHGLRCRANRVHQVGGARPRERTSPPTRGDRWAMPAERCSARPRRGTHRMAQAARYREVRFDPQRHRPSPGASRGTRSVSVPQDCSSPIVLMSTESRWAVLRVSSQAAYQRSPQRETAWVTGVATLRGRARPVTEVAQS